MSTSGGRGVPVRFGTSGWRGVLGDDFTLEGARRAAAAVAAWVRAEAGPGARVVVAHDTRFLADRVAASVARVLAGAELWPIRADRAVPTPVASHAVRRRRAAAGIVVTASHNPPEYLGLKVVAPWGGSADREITGWLEAHAARSAGATAPPERAPRGRPLDLVGPYADALLAKLDRGALRRSGLHVTYDAFHATGAGVLDAVLRRAGVAVTLRRGEPDPLFGGAPPDPSAEQLRALARDVRAGRGLRLGLATDGDADRYGVVDADGRPLRESEALALLVDHLARSGRVRRGVAISVATGTLVERVARAHGLPVTRHPIGFKHLTRPLLEGHADVAGEESAGFAWAPLVRDKDGVLAGCLLAEIVATTRAPLRQRLRELERAHGRHLCGRSAWPVDEGAPRALAALARRLPTRFDGARVRDADTREGVRLCLDDGFVMWRVSGTEPVLRVYAEAPSARALERRLAAARRALARAGRRRS